MKIAPVLILGCGCAFYPRKRLNKLERASLRWNSAALQGVHDSKLSAPVTSRALGIVHGCMYDAWAAYDERAIGTQLEGVLRRPSTEQTLRNKEEAISYAAYRALTDVLPGETQSVLQVVHTGVTSPTR